MIGRRQFLQSAGLGALCALAGSRAAFAAAPTDNRLVLIILRGGLDALHALPPYADRDYRRLRPTLAVRAPGEEGGAVDLDGHFGLHPALGPLLPLHAAGELLFIPAASTRYRNRSHFDGQNMLENGSGKPYGANDGWLNRALLGMHGGDRRLGLALGPAVPLILQGDAGIQAWANTKLPHVDEDFLARLAHAYEHDRVFAKALREARESLKPAVDMSGMAARPLQANDFLISAKAAADLLSRPDGPRVAVLEIQGWDTHFDQQRRLGLLFGQLSTGLLAMKEGLGAAWPGTAIVVVSEFGRTAAENGSRGTDHGTGGLAMLAGGAVAGGRVAGGWPGLAANALFEGRDLRSVNDYEGLFKAILTGHLGLPPGFVEEKVFPGSRESKAIDGLLRRA